MQNKQKPLTPTEALQMARGSRLPCSERLACHASHPATPDGCRAAAGLKLGIAVENLRRAAGLLMGCYEHESAEAVAGLAESLDEKRERLGMDRYTLRAGQ